MDKSPENSPASVDTMLLAIKSYSGALTKAAQEVTNTHTSFLLATVETMAAELDCFRSLEEWLLSGEELSEVKLREILKTLEVARQAGATRMQPHFATMTKLASRNPPTNPTNSTN